ncbi:unnamed protein product [Paramecium sonneborni]|uniref:Uncharacterized protein n=1 Tax=Paramecium sonneborni TaxID=65129 RepID=A0A8S1R8E1_9CILI|nr:unnamed protein product [Paramecium sonneborni]
MSQLSSVERTTRIESFSTFFDRLSSHNPQREQMLKYVLNNQPFDEFKQKFSNVFRTIQQLDNDDFFNY